MWIAMLTLEETATLSRPNVMPVRLCLSLPGLPRGIFQFFKTAFVAVCDPCTAVLDLVSFDWC